MSDINQEFKYIGPSTSGPAKSSPTPLPSSTTAPSTTPGPGYCEKTGESCPVCDPSYKGSRFVRNKRQISKCRD